MIVRTLGHRTISARQMPTQCLRHLAPAEDDFNRRTNSSTRMGRLRRPKADAIWAIAHENSLSIRTGLSRYEQSPCG